MLLHGIIDFRVNFCDDHHAGWKERYEPERRLEYLVWMIPYLNCHVLLLISIRDAVITYQLAFEMIINAGVYLSR